MKTCSKCGSQFGDEMSYCLNDGTLLVAPTDTAEYGANTVELPAEPPTQEFTPEQPTGSTFQPPPHAPTGKPQFSPPGVERQGSRSRFLLPLVLTGLGLATFGAATIGLGVYFYSKSSDMAMANVNEVNRPAGNPQNIGTNSNSTNLPPAFPGSNSSITNSGPTSANAPAPSATPRNQAPTPNPSKAGTPTITEPTPESRSTPKRALPTTISGGVLNGRAINLPKPPYPPAARAVRASGAVTVQVLIDENGQVVSASAVSGHPLLRGAAEQAARGARFSPTMLSGQPVKVSGVIVYNFVP